jgi:hypothetical protein
MSARLVVRAAVLALPLVAGGVGATDPAPAPAPAAAAAEVAAAAPQPPTQLEQLVRGQLPDGVALAEVFPFDLLNDTDVAARRAELEQRLAAPDLEPGARRELELRLQILSSPPAFRRSLVEADARRLAAQLERERAEAERRQAEEDARKAEEARLAALEAAEAARSAAEKFYATESAKAELARLEQAKARQRLADRRATLNQPEAAAVEESLRERVLQAEAQDPANRALYEECVAVLTEARARVRAALDAVSRPLEVPRYALPGQLPAESTLAESRQRLTTAAAEIAAAATELEAQARRLRHDTARAAYDRQQRLNAVRLTLLEKLSDADRSEILGWGRAGLQQLGREWEHLRLQLRWYRYARANIGVVWTTVTEDPAQVLKLIRDAVLFAALCIGAALAARRRERWLELAGTWAARVARDEHWRRAALGALSGIERVWPELLLVAVALLSPWALGRVAEIAEVVVVLRLFLLFALYRLILTLSYRGIAWLSAGASLAPRLRTLTLRSLRLIGIYLLVTAAVLVLSEEVLGRGYLYSLVANVWLVGGLPIAAVLVRWWQPDIVDGYLKFRPDGSMADAVRATRERWYGFFVAVAAVVVLMAVAAARVAARFALGFDQTRKALAFLFRRRLERQAEQQPEEAKEALAEDLVKHLTEDPVSRAELLTDHLPGLDEFLKAAKAWAEGQPPIPSLLVGDTGFGKTTWLLAAEARLKQAGIAARVLTLPQHADEPARLLAWLAKGLELKADSWEQLAAALAARPPEVVLIDDGHLLFSRRLGGFGAWDAFAGIAGTAASRTFWLIALARFPYDYLLWARNNLTAPFRRVWKLKPWSDTDIAALLKARTDAAGYRVRYDDLVVDRVEGVERHAQLLRTETEYARLIWDYADGCPRTALRCWRASLSPAGPRTVSVRLFRRPAVERIERLSQRERFILASLVWHQSVTPGLAAAVLRYPESLCADTLALLRDWQVVREDGGVYRLESDWLQPVRRLLRRENLLVT